jgi:uncharacterized protein (DUF885 family)
MRNLLKVFLPALVCFSAAAFAAPDPAADFNALVDQYFDAYFATNPTDATQAGFHQHDSKLEDYSAAGRKREIAGLRDYLAKFEKLDRTNLPADTADDLDWIISSIHGDLLELETIQGWKKDPDTYTSGITNSIFLVMKRNYAPPEDRLRSVIARERQFPRVFTAARVNLQNPPRIYTEIALEQLPDVINFYRKDVPEAFSQVKDAKLLADFKAANQAAIADLETYQKFLHDTVLPRSHGEFRLGAETYRKKLLYDEMVDIPLDRLLEIGYADLRRNQQQMKEVAAQIDPKRTVAQVLAEVQNHHPAPDQLLQAFRDTFAGLQQFIAEKKIITIPPGEPPTLEDTPPFMRATTFASLDTPGAYETKDNRALFNVTTADPKWTPEHTEDWMRSFNNSIIPGTAIHEAFPGHFVQFLWVNQLSSKVRKLTFCSSNAEGWAHYTEQMMLDEGYGNGDPKLRMGQLEDALLRNARYIVGIKMHTAGMTLAQAEQFFVQEGYQPSSEAKVETKRGTSDPTYLVYTLGKLQILKLREDYRKKQSADFTLLEFHNRLMQQGGVPLKIIRKAMLGDDSPTL